MRNLMELLPTKAYQITTGGEIAEISTWNGVTFELDEVQKAVEGYIEVVRLTEKQIMIVNEEGKFDKRYNAFATAIAHLHGAIPVRDYICGNVVICPSEMLP